MTSALRRPRSWLAFQGAVCAAAAVALAAYSAHVAAGEAQARLQLAAAFAFGHGLALAVLAPMATRRLARFALSLLYLGVLLFSGSLVFNVLALWPTALAPFGGALLIGGWLLYAADSLRT